MEALLLKVAVWSLSLFGGAAVLENTLENYLMEHLPPKLRGLVVPVVSLAFAIVANLYGGMAWPDALAGAFALAGATTTIHNHPDLTSALPQPPATADGVPGQP